MEFKLSVTKNFDPLPDEKQKSLILEGQNYNCKCCDIEIKDFARFHKDKEITEFVALCSVCYGSQHLEQLPLDKAGQMIMLAGISQVELISISRSIELIKRLDADESADDIDSASTIGIMLAQGHHQSNTYYAVGSSDVELLAQMLSNQDEESYARRDEGLYNILWLPDYSIYKKELDYWFDLLMKDESSPYHRDKWESMSNKIKKKINK